MTALFGADRNEGMDAPSTPSRVYVARVRYHHYWDEDPELRNKPGIGYLGADGKCYRSLEHAQRYESSDDAWTHLAASEVLGHDDEVGDWAWVETLTENGHDAQPLSGGGEPREDRVSRVWGHRVRQVSPPWEEERLLELNSDRWVLTLAPELMIWHHRRGSVSDRQRRLYRLLWVWTAPRFSDLFDAVDKRFRFRSKCGEMALLRREARALAWRKRIMDRTLNTPTEV